MSATTKILVFISFFFHYFFSPQNIKYFYLLEWKLFRALFSPLFPSLKLFFLHNFWKAINNNVIYFDIYCMKSRMNAVICHCLLDCKICSWLKISMKSDIFVYIDYELQTMFSWSLDVNIAITWSAMMLSCPDERKVNWNLLFILIEVIF